ncbi:MAG TPA: protein translocase subunit SecF [Ghiorsea sp.]|nr:protein translocase subunit SecF [Ghiorsea sp.]HIP07086.1 protein translocase subunit SecF [Mariprofundaceae bacterium]
MQLIRPDININFLANRKKALTFSAIMLIVSLALIMFKGLNLGIDFTGGTLVEVRFHQQVQIADIRASLEPEGYGKAVIQEFGSPEEILIRVQNREDVESSVISTTILDALTNTFGADQVEMRRVEFVGPQVGEELKAAGMWAVIYTLGGILLYVMFRFKLRFALGADAAILHDIIIVVGVFSLLGLEFSLSVVAALLTVLGYSLNDTIVVFDRIRENFASNKKQKHPEDEVLVCNRSINQTLARTLMTSVTTLLVVFSLYFLGGEVIHNFAFALLVGIAVGTYSSIFIASPIMLSLEGKFEMSDEELKEMEAKP